MATFGWIVDDNVDHIADVTPLPILGAVVPRKFICDSCGAVLESEDALRSHYSLSHPLALPALLIHDRPLLRDAAIRDKVPQGSIVLLNCTECDLQIDGGEWKKLSPLQFRERLARSGTATWNVRLVHKRDRDASEVREQYLLRVRIPSNSKLDVIDERFLDMLVRDSLSHDHLDAFQAALPDELAAREYAAALGDYALGVLLKERRQPPWSQVGFDAFSRQFRSALDVLQSFRRPIAIAVCDSIRFNLNDFRDYGTSIATEADIAIRFLRTFDHPGAEIHARKARGTKTGSRRAICPIDGMTHRLMSACWRAVAGTGHCGMDLVASLTSFIAGESPVSEQDLAKLHVLCADGLLHSVESSEARRYLLAIQFDAVFGRWAQEQLRIHFGYQCS